MTRKTQSAVGVSGGDPFNYGSSPEALESDLTLMFQLQAQTHLLDTACGAEKHWRDKVIIHAADSSTGPRGRFNLDLRSESWILLDREASCELFQAVSQHNVAARPCDCSHAGWASPDDVLKNMVPSLVLLPPLGPDLGQVATPCAARC